MFKPKYILLVYVALCAASLFLFGRAYWQNYSNSDGLKLANGRIVGGDFVCFHIAGKLLAEAPAELYNLQKQFELEEAVFQQGGLRENYLPFVYPPLVAVMFQPFSKLSLYEAYLLWALLSVVFTCGSLYLVSRTLELSVGQSMLVAVLASGFPLFLLDAVGSGQTSSLGIFIYALVYILLKRGREFGAGAALGLAYYKPPLFLLFGLVMLLQGRWRMMMGASLMLSLLLVLSWFQIGSHGALSYFLASSKYTYGVELIPGYSLPASRGVGLFGTLSEILGEGSFAARVLFALALVAGVFGALRLSNIAGNNLELLFAALLSLSLFFSVHIISYDLSLLVLAFALTIVSLRSRVLCGWGYLLLFSVFGLYIEWCLRPGLGFWPCRIFFFASCLGFIGLALQNREGISQSRITKRIG